MTRLLGTAQRLVERALNVEIARPKTPRQRLWHSLLAVKEIASVEGDEASRFMAACRERLGVSRAQVFQDVFALHQTGDKRGGFFVEFGATNGVDLSNTWLLENAYGWQGILAEPARAWHGDLARNRKCAIDYRCVTAASGEKVVFNEVEWAEFSTIDAYSASDRHAAGRAGGKRYEVETVSLNDLLEQHRAPREFDYLSVDTEGSELLILASLDFARFRPAVVTVEHNFVEPRRAQMHDLLASRGYRRKFEELSMFDDWYVHG